MVVHKHTAASISTRPCSSGQHWFTTGSPSPMWTSPPSKSTHAPSFNVSIGHVAGPAGVGTWPGGHGTLEGGPTMTGGFPMTGGTVTGGFPMTGGMVTGGFPMTGGRMMGAPLGGLCLDLGGWIGLVVGGQEPQERVGGVVEMRMVRIMRRVAESLVESMLAKIIHYLG